MSARPLPSEAFGMNFPLDLITSTGLSSCICTCVTCNAAQKPLPNRSHFAKPQTHHSLGTHDLCCLQSWQAVGKLQIQSYPTANAWNKLQFHMSFFWLSSLFRLSISNLEGLFETQYTPVSHWSPSLLHSRPRHPGFVNDWPDKRHKNKTKLWLRMTDTKSLTRTVNEHAQEVKDEFT